MIDDRLLITKEAANLLSVNFFAKQRAASASLYMRCITRLQAFFQQSLTVSWEGGPT